MGEKDDYLTSYRVFFENFAATVDPEDQLPVNIAGYTITEAELPGEVIYWTTQYLTEKQCPLTLMAPLQRIILEEVQVASKKHPNEFGYNSDDSEYIALRLMQAVTARVNDVCLRYLDNSRLDTLPPPPPPSMREYRTVSSATKNVRRVMEDRHVEFGNLEALFGIETTEPTSFYAVYDGHAGSAAATYCAAHLHQYLVESPHFTRDLRQAMHDAYLRTDAEFVRKSNQKRASGGSTAVSVALRGRRLVAAWAGDSLALLVKRMRLMQLVNPHKPDRADERKRIESTGGKVMYWGTWRVNGQLAVSRAIGDAKYKPCVTARPEITEVDLDGDEDFVVVACDGLWDVVSEDAVAVSVYKQLMNDPNDLKAVPKNLIRQAKKDGSEDNISIIVVFLKDPRDIVADNCPPMDLGLDNAVVNAPPFAVENEACKLVAEAGGGDCAEGGDNSISDSDSDDLGPETAVDADLDIDDDAEMNHDPAPPTPPAHAVGESHVDGNLVDNVAESGEESEDEWNYYKGEGEREQNHSEEADEPPRSETPCQDNSAWESSSVDMNSSPLNPDAPVFVPGNVAGSDVLLAESPRKPLPMDDIELPDVAQFQTEAIVRPAELQDLDNCDQLNGHHNISMEGVTEHLNGNDKCEMESLGFGFNVGIEQDKIKDTSLIQDFERIQKDTTDFCNIQVFQSHTETNPFNVEGDDELFERLKNKERDPMSMSFYQEKDDDTCERFGKTESNVDLNAVQPLPDSDDEDIQPNGYQNREDKENVCPEERSNLLNLVENVLEPNNDIMRFDERSDIISNNVSNLDNLMDYSNQNSNNMQNYSNSEFECNLQETVVQSETPESHKLLFEQIPEIPDGKSSELGFNNEDLLDPSESEKDTRAITPQDETSQDIEMESKLDESPTDEAKHEIIEELKDDQIEDDISEQTESEKLENEIRLDNAISPEISAVATPEPSKELEENKPSSPELTQENVVVDVHADPQHHSIDTFIQSNVAEDQQQLFDDFESNQDKFEPAIKAPEIRLEAEAPEVSLETEDKDNEEQVESELPDESPAPSPLPTESLLPSGSSLPRESPLPNESPLPRESPLARESSLPRDSPLPSESPLPQESLISKEISQSHESPLPRESSLPRESPLPQEEQIVPQEALLTQESLQQDSPVPKSPLPSDSFMTRESPLPQELLKSRESSMPRESPLGQELLRESPLPSESPLPEESVQPVSPMPSESLIPSESPVQSVPEVVEPITISKSPLPSEVEVLESPAQTLSPLPSQSPVPQDTSETLVPAEVPLPRESPLPTESPVVEDILEPVHVDEITHKADISESPIPTQTFDEQSTAQLPVESPLPSTEKELIMPDLSDSPIPVIQSESEMELPEVQQEEKQLAEKIEHIQESLEAVEASTTKSPVPVDFYTEMVPKELVSSDTERPESQSLATEQVSEVEARVTPTIPIDTIEASQVQGLPAGFSAPAPDIVPEERPRNELVYTDITESRAQEICVPVTCEIQHDDAAQASAAPPPAVPSALGDAPIAAATAAVAAAAATAAVASAATKAKLSPKKSPTTPTAKTDKTTAKATPKTTTTARTPLSAKRPASATATPKSPAAAPARAAPRTPVSASKAPAARPAAKAAAPPAKPAPKPAAPRAAPAPRPATAARAPAPTKAAPVAKPLAAKPAAPAKSASAPAKPAAPRPAPITRPAPAAAKPKEVKPKPPPITRPVTNGDVKAPAKPPARAPAARPAPRPTPRPASATAPPKPAAPKPAARAPLDKQSKDLANKRITAKAAPPRTATTKAPGGIKSVAKKSLESKKEAAKLANGVEAGGDALLPDVIA